MIRFCQTTMPDKKKPVIALDCDGVLLDYQTTFKNVYEQTFGVQLEIIRPNAYRSEDTFQVRFSKEEKMLFETKWEEIGWRTMPHLPGSVEACHLLHQAGYELICVTAMPQRFADHRLENFRLHGFPIDKVIGLDKSKKSGSHNPKKEIIEELNPLIFVDDLKRNFIDLESLDTQLVYIDYQRDGDPYNDADIFYHASYPSLLTFVKDFLADEQEHGKFVKWAERQ